MRSVCLFFFLTAFLLWAGDAYAYIGPGLGLGTIGVVLGFLASVFLAVFAVIFYPVKRLLKKKRKQKEKAETKARDV